MIQLRTECQPEDGFTVRHCVAEREMGQLQHVHGET